MTTTRTKIAVINESTAISNAKVQGVLKAFETQWNRDLAPAWDIAKVDMVFVSQQEQAPRDAWWLVWLDNSDQADALAYHDLTDHGAPLSKVFVKTIEAEGASLTVAATHELCEMAIDPTINLAAQDARGMFWAYESADPVEADEFAYEIDGVLVTDFVLPSWFDFKGSSGPYDFKGHCTDAFQVLRGGYAQRFDTDAGWVQINASITRGARALLPSHGSRRDRRHRGRAHWSRSGNHEYRGAARSQLQVTR
jgi:hypothetical protein